MLQNTNSTPLPGSVIKIDCGSYYHYAIVSDVKGNDGNLTLIDLSRETGTVSERLWSRVVGSRRWFVSKIECCFSSQQIVRRARAQISKRKYSISAENCEHFVTSVVNGNPNSSQVINGFIVGSFASLTAYKVSKDSALIAGLIGLGTGLLAAKISAI